MEKPQILSPSSSGKRRSVGSSNSPEFEFWNIARNPSVPETDLHSADELFADGILLPLHLLHLSDDPPDHNPEPPTALTTTNDDSESGPVHASGLKAPGGDLPPTESLVSAFTTSKRWKDIFKKNPNSSKKDNDKEKEKKKERKGGGGGVGAAELNINLWPFSRSRSAGTGGSRPRVVATRKVSSAPCSRSNSAGESKSRKWPSSPSRGGVHLGRSSPVWTVRRAGSGRNAPSEPLVSNAEKGIKKEGNDTRRSKKSAGDGGGGAKAKVLNLNVPTCIGYRQHLSCRSDISSEVRVAAGNSVGAGQNARVSSGDGGRPNSNLFNFRSLFTKKVY